MIRVAALRSKSLKIFRQKNLTRLARTNKLDIVEEGCELDVALVSWLQDIPKEWLFSIHCLAESSEPTNLDLLNSGSLHYYKTHGHVAVWIRYLAIRRIVSSILVRLLSALPQGLSISEQIDACQNSINSLATDMCCSVLFFLNNAIQYDSESSTFGINDNNASPEILPRITTILAWPLSVAVSTEVVPVTQKEWLRRKLKTVASVQGDGVLQSIAEAEQFKF
jgi:hypothetical protein